MSVFVILLLKFKEFGGRGQKESTTEGEGVPSNAADFFFLLLCFTLIA
jgi:hypothetical protein